MDPIIIDNEFIKKQKNANGRVILGSAYYVLSPEVDLTNISLVGCGIGETFLDTDACNEAQSKKLLKPLTGLSIKGNKDEEAKVG